jgi:hypothetical protein
MDLNNIINIGSDNGSSVSLSKALLIFYVLIASQFTGGLIGKQLREYIQENRIAQHIISFIMLLVIIHLIGGVNDMKKVVIYGTIGYIWFIFTTKLDIHWNLIVILLLVIGYLYENNIFNDEQLILTKDQVLSSEEKSKIINKNKNYRSYIVVGILLTTLVGTLLYEQKKGVQYGGGFSILKYLFY